MPMYWAKHKEGSCLKFEVYKIEKKICWKEKCLESFVFPLSPLINQTNSFVTRDNAKNAIKKFLS